MHSSLDSEKPGALAWLEDLKRDIAYGLRTFMRAPGFTAVAVLTLALGIGANTAIFSIVNAVLLQPLPYRDPNTLAAVWNSNPRNPNASRLFLSYSDFQDFKSHSHSFDQLAAATWFTGDQLMTGRGSARQVLAIPASVDFFNLLGVSPDMGRTFTADDLNHGCTVVLSNRFWRSVLQEQKDIVGQSLRLEQSECTVIGVMPPGFTFYPDAAAMWMLITPDSAIARNPVRSRVAVFGRLKAGVTPEAARGDLAGLYQQAHQGDTRNKDNTPLVAPLQGEFTWLAGRNLRLSLIVLFAAVVCVLLIACVNIANLLLGRSLARQKELAIRSALGSGRARLVRQLLTEDLLLSFTGAGLGMLLAWAAVSYFRSVNPIEMPPGRSVGISLEVLLFTTGLAVLTAFAFGLIPALRVSKLNMNEIVKTAGRGSSYGFGRHFLSRTLVVAEVSLSLVLLVGAGLLIETMNRFSTASLGFSRDSLLTMSVSLPRWSYPAQGERSRFYSGLLTGVAELPGAQGVALTTSLPPAGLGGHVLGVQGRPDPPPADAVREINLQSVSSDYFSVIATPIQAGRMFSDADTDQTTQVAIVNQALVHKYFPGEDPLGKQIRIADPGSTGDWFTVVGVVANEKHTNVYQEMTWADVPSVFRPINQDAPAVASLVIREPNDAALTGGTVQKKVESLDPNVPVNNIQTMEERISKYLAYPRFRAILLGVFAGLALLLAVIGLYGVLSHLVTQRTQEIGVRMALGAQKAHVLKLILGQGVLLAAVGLVVGLVVTKWLTRFVAGLLFGVQASDLSTMIGVSAVVLTAAFLATYIPARRAAGMDPLVALRHE